MDLRFSGALACTAAAGLLVLYLAAPGRTDLVAAAALGAGFGGLAGVCGWEAVRRAAARSPERGVQVFLAVMTGKVLAFAAFLLAIALTTSLHPAALGGGLVGVTLAGEALVIVGLRRIGTDRA